MSEVGYVQGICLLLVSLVLVGIRLMVDALAILKVGEMIATSVWAVRYGRRYAEEVLPLVEDQQRPLDLNTLREID